MGTSGLGHLTCILASAEVFSFPGAKESMMGKRDGWGGGVRRRRSVNIPEESATTQLCPTSLLHTLEIQHT